MTERQLKFVSHNCQKSNDNMHYLLETHKESDIILVQEPYWGFIKSVVTGVDANGVAFGSMGFTPQAAQWSSKEGYRTNKLYLTRVLPS